MAHIYLTFDHSKAFRIWQYTTSNDIVFILTTETNKSHDSNYKILIGKY